MKLIYSDNIQFIDNGKTSWNIEGPPDLDIFDYSIIKGIRYDTGQAIYHKWDVTQQLVDLTQSEKDYIMVYIENREVPTETISIENLKAQKIKEIDFQRTLANQNYFLFEGHRVAIDPLSRGDLDAVADYIALNNDFPEGWLNGWRSMDGVDILVHTIERFRLLQEAMVDQGIENFLKSLTLKERVAAATTESQVNEIVW